MMVVLHDSRLLSYQFRSVASYLLGFDLVCSRRFERSQSYHEFARLLPKLQVIGLRYTRVESEFYLCLLHGKPKRGEATLKDYMIKNENKNKVTVFHHPVEGSKEMITKEIL